MSEYTRVLAFDNDTLDFVLGAEVGRTFERLRHNKGPVEAVLHAENAEMILRIAEATGRSVRSDELEDGWLHVWFTERQKGHVS